MRAQIDRLIAVQGLPSMRLGIIPMGRVIPARELADVALYDDYLAKLWEQADEGEAVRALLMRVLGEGGMPSKYRSRWAVTLGERGCRSCMMDLMTSKLPRRLTPAGISVRGAAVRGLHKPATVTKKAVRVPRAMVVRVMSTPVFAGHFRKMVKVAKSPVKPTRAKYPLPAFAGIFDGPVDLARRAKDIARGRDAD
jgi:hypothetical protein